MAESWTNFSDITDEEFAEMPRDQQIALGQEIARSVGEELTEAEAGKLVEIHARVMEMDRAEAERYMETFNREQLDREMTGQNEEDTMPRIKDPEFEGKPREERAELIRQEAARNGEEMPIEEARQAADHYARICELEDQGEAQRGHDIAMAHGFTERSRAAGRAGYAYEEPGSEPWSSGPQLIRPQRDREMGG